MHAQVNKKRFIGNTYVKIVYSDSNMDILCRDNSISSLSGQTSALTTEQKRQFYPLA
jgi:hypothetical protein